MRKKAGSFINMIRIQWSTQEAAGFAGQPEAEAKDKDVRIFNIKGAAEAMGWKACLKMSATLLRVGPSEGARDCKKVQYPQASFQFSPSSWRSIASSDADGTMLVQTGRDPFPT